MHNEIIIRFSFFSFDNIVKEIKGTTIGHKRIITFPTIHFDKISIRMNDLYSRDNFKSMEVYKINEALIN